MSFPAFGSSFRKRIPDDWSGILFHEIPRMKKYVKFFSGSRPIIRAARKIVHRCPPKDYRCEAETLFAFTKEFVRFVRDPYNKEAIQRPDTMLYDILTEGMADGDCDEIATFLSTILSAIGFPTRFRFGGTRGTGLHHVWVQAKVPRSGWMDLDATVDLKPGYVLPFDMYAVEEIW